MAAPEGIDWTWALATGGALSRDQRRQLRAPLVRAVGGYLRSRARLAVGRRGRGGVDLDALRWPDSALARAAEEELRDTLPPVLVEHSYRTYVFGLSLAALDGADVDQELCYVASLLHDLAIQQPTPNRCFAVVGGEQAQRLALDQGADADRASRIGAAVAAHITAGAAEDLSDPGGFVSGGSLLDVTGARLDELDPAWVAALLRRHPRHDLKRVVVRVLTAEAAAVPAGRTRWMVGVGGVTRLARVAPFQDGGQRTAGRTGPT